MTSISLGPLALPLMPVLLLAALWMASALAARVARRAAAGPSSEGGTAPSPDAAANAVLLAGGVGLLAARLAWLALHADAYAATPWAMLDLRDGGWWAPAGWLAGAAALAWRGWRAPALRRALAAAGGLLAAVALAGMLLQQLRDAAVMPAQPLVPLAGGAAISLQQAAAGRPAVVNLWATWCPPCRAEMPMLAAAQKRHPDVAFLFVNQGESAPTVQAWLAGQDYTLRQVLLDGHAALGPAVGSRGLPTTLFYDAQGRQLDAHFGMLNAAALDSRLQGMTDAR